MASGAIQTEYKGLLFRSRLEARWAVFFDTLGMEWKYETEGFEVDGFRYLPDFWLPEQEIWVEVKGDPDALRKDAKRMLTILGPNSPLPGFADGRSPLVFLGDVPNVSSGQTVMHPCLQRAGGPLMRTFGFFLTRKVSGAAFVWDKLQSWMYLPYGNYLWSDIDESSDAWNAKPWLWETPGTPPRMLEAYKAARQARFEHGATGR